RAPSGHGPLVFGFAYVCWPDGYPVAVLPLLDSHWLGDVDPAVVELDHPVKGREIQFGDGIANLVRVGAGGRFDGFDKRYAARRRVGALVRRLVVERLFVQAVVRRGRLEQILTGVL